MKFKTQQLAIADFQLIYDTDSFIQLDFYAEGLRLESLLYNQPIYLERISYGYVKGDLNRYQENEQVFQGLLKNREWVDRTSMDMVKSVRAVQRMNRKIEKSLKEKTISAELWKSYFMAIAHMLSYKRFSDLCEPMLFSNNKEIDKQEMKNIHTPSHIFLFHQALENLKDQSGDEDIKKFIHLFGFLYDFNIQPTPFETIEGVKNYLASAHSVSSITKEKRRRRIPKTFSALLYKRIACYEEWRHYHQARAVRNYRELLHLLKMDIYETGIDDLEEMLEGRLKDDVYSL